MMTFSSSSYCDKVLKDTSESLDTIFKDGSSNSLDSDLSTDPLTNYNNNSMMGGSKAEENRRFLINESLRASTAFMSSLDNNYPLLYASTSSDYSTLSDYNSYNNFINLNTNFNKLPDNCSINSSNGYLSLSGNSNDKYLIQGNIFIRMSATVRAIIQINLGDILLGSLAIPIFAATTTYTVGFFNNLSFTSVISGNNSGNLRFIKYPGNSETSNAVTIKANSSILVRRLGRF